jgi:ribosomal protein L20A (L18A)
MILDVMKMAKKFNITGTIDIGEIRKFAKEVEAPTENAAKEKVLSLFGSQNGVIRSKIKIEKIEAL